MKKKYLLILNGAHKYLMYGIPLHRDEHGKTQKNETLCLWQTLDSFQLNRPQSDKLGMVSLIVYEEYEVKIEDRIAYILK